MHGNLRPSNDLPRLHLDSNVVKLREAGSLPERLGVTDRYHLQQARQSMGLFNKKRSSRNTCMFLAYKFMLWLHSMSIHCAISLQYRDRMFRSKKQESRMRSEGAENIARSESPTR